MPHLKESNVSKEYYKIKEVAEFLGVPQSTLRYWEKEFPEVAPRRSATNQRYYTEKEIETLRIIHFLLKTRGMKIEAARQQLATNRRNISKRVEIIRHLTAVREDLHGLLKALDKRGAGSCSSGDRR